MKPSMQNFLRQRSLRTVFTFPLVTLIVATVALTGYLSFRNGQDAVNVLVSQLHRTATARIEQRLDGYLETPHLINQLNLDSIHMRMRDAPNTISLQSDFLSQLQRFPWVVSIAYADEQKGYVGPARKVLGAELVMVTSSENTHYTAETYSIDNQGNRLKLLKSNPEYDPRMRPWYQTAVQSGHETWVPIFLWTSGDVGLDLVAPVYDNEGKLLGVLDTSLTLIGIGEFLASMDVSPHGQSFIMERSGLLVASSTIREPYTVVGDDLIRLSARESKDPVVRSAALAVEQQLDNLTSFASSEQFEFDLDGERELLQVTPYRDDYGLDWLIVTIIPESDFTSQINESNRGTILLIIASLLASILLATYMTNWVTRPILHLNQAVKAIAHGNWSEPVPVNRQDEVGELARSFNDMGQQLKISFAQLQASEERYRNLFTGVPIGLYRSTQAGEILDANPALVHLFGYPNLETLLAVNASDFYVNQEDRTRWRDTIEHEGVVEDFQVQMRRFDGTSIWVRNNAHAIMDDRAQLLYYYEGSLEDITERKRANEAIRKSEQVLREAESLGHTGSWEQDLITREIFNTEENLRLFFGDDHSKGADFEDYAEAVHPDDREYVMQRRVQLLTDRGPSDIEYRVVWPDGSVHVIFGRATVVYDELGQALRVYGTNVDITERKQAEDALRESQRKYKNLVETSHDLIWSVDANGQITFLNRAAKEIYGYEPEELIGRSFLEVMDPEHYPRDLKSFKEEIAQADEFKEVEARVRHRDGRHFILSANSIVVRDEFGNPVSVSGSSRDITARKQAEEEIRQYAARLEALAEISQALAEVGLDVQAVFETIVRHTAELIGDTCVIRLLSSDEQWLRSAAFHNPNPEVRALMRLLYPTTPASANLSWFTTVLRTSQPLLIPVITLEQLRRSVQPEYLPFFEQVGLHSVLIVPLRVRGRVIGTLGLSRDRPGRPYTPDDQVFLQDLADRASLTIHNAQLFEQVQGAREQLGSLSRRLLEVQESERRALTTELHDRVGQNLTGLSINLQNLKALLSDEMAKTLATKFEDAQTLVEHTTRQIRDIMAELHPPELEDYGLAAALETYAEGAASRGNLELIADLPDLAPPSLPSDVLIALFRAAQEAITNVLKHADATQLEVSLEKSDGRIHLRVEDDGKGFEPDVATQKEAQTWGLKIMRERIESIGGKVQIESERGEGTRVTFEIEGPS